VHCRCRDYPFVPTLSRFVPTAPWLRSKR